MKRCKRDSGRLCAAAFISSAHGHWHNCTPPPTKIFHPFHVRKKKPASLDTIGGGGGGKTERIWIYVYTATLTETVTGKNDIFIVSVGFVSQRIYRRYFIAENLFGVERNRSCRIERTCGALNLCSFFFFDLPFFFTNTRFYLVPPCVEIPV
jgi:hypothetical protein